MANVKKESGSQQVQTWDIKNENFRITEVKIAEKVDSDKEKVKLLYDKYEQFDSITFPTNINGKWKFGGIEFDVNI